MSAVQRNGELIETEHGAWTNDTRAATDGSRSDSRNFYLQLPGHDRDYRIDQEVRLQLTSWLAGQLEGHTCMDLFDGDSFTGDLTSVIDEVLGKDETGLQQLMANVVNAMATALRMSSQDGAEGFMLVNETHIRIQWGWITLPVALFFLTVCFVKAVAWTGDIGDVKVNVWKNDLVAALFHGMDRDLLAKVCLLNDQESIDETAKELAAKLIRGGHGLRLGNEESFSYELK